MRFAQLLSIATALALASGCVKDNELFDAGADADADSDADTDTDTDTGTCEPEAYQACHNGDVYWFDSCDQPGDQVDDCDDEHGTCVVLSATEAECDCLDHWDIATGCTTCETNWDPETGCTACVIGYGGEACAVCEVGYTGDGCADCATDYSLTGAVCEYQVSCGADWLWLIDGALPAAERSADEFETGGTSTEPTVVDTVTGLEWRICLEGMGWSDATCQGMSTAVAAGDAAALCFATTYAGLEDWRLADVTELGTLVNHASLPLILGEVFPNFGQPVIWTETECPIVDTDNWVVAFFNGAVTGVNYESRVLCVRSDPDPEPPLPPRFTVAAADGSTVLDEWTALEWRRCASGQVWTGAACAGVPASYDWQTAQLACDGSFAGHDDWVLPDTAQNRSLVNYCAERAAAFEAAFPGQTDEQLWSSTADAIESAAFSVSMELGESTPVPTDDVMPVRCVRQPD